MIASSSPTAAEVAVATATNDCKEEEESKQPRSLLVNFEVGLVGEGEGSCQKGGGNNQFYHNY